MANPDSTYTGSSSNDSLYGGSGRDWMRGLAGNDWLSGAGGDDTLEGGDGNDTLIGDVGNDSLVGGAGSDTLNGGAGNDALIGGAILDRVNLTDLNFSSYSSATSGVNVNLATGTAQDGLGGTDTLQDINYVQGSGFADTLTGSTSFNLFEQFEGMAGNDTINGGAIDPITGNNGNRVAYHNSTAGVTVNLGTGTASDGFGGTDTLININQVRGSNHADVLTGSDSAAYTEAFEGRAGNDTVDGKGGYDQVRYDPASSAVNVNLATGVAQDGQGGTDSLLNIEGIRGSNFNDVLTGGNAANGTGTTDGFEFFQGNGGNDTMDGGAGYDRVDFGSSTSGVNVVLGGAVNGTAQDGLGGTDTLVNIEGVRGSDLNDVLTGSDSGVFESFEGRAGNDTINGMGGVDRADYSGDWAAVNVNLATGLALDGFGGTDTLINIEQVRGSAFNDTIAGGAGNDILQGYGGNDTLTGGGGNDTFLFASGGHGVDLITDFGAGDTINVRMAALSKATPTTGNGSTVTGKGIQVLTVAGVTTLYLDTNNVAGAEEQIQLAGVYSASGFTVVNTPEGYTNITYTGTVTSGGDITGTSGNDSLVGGVIGDSIIGLEGNDTLIGGNGNDTLLGRAGDDSLSGGAGSDFLSGEAGNDTLDGGAILDRTNYADLNIVSYITATGGIVVNLQTGVVNDGFGSTDTVSNVNFVTASNQADSITGSNTFNLFEQFEGLGGNDTINGGLIDTVTGNNSNRVEYGASPFAVNVSLLSGTAQDGFGGTDTLININQVRGSNYNDTLTGSDTSLYTESFQGRGGNDTINGMGGNDQVRYDSATTGVTVNLATGVATDGQGGTDTLQNIEGIRGSNFNDSLTGGNPANGSAATDGFEFFEGRAGNDTIDGGTGYDRADYTSSTAGVNVILGGTGNGTAQDGWGSTDTLISIEAVRGSEFADVLTGSDSGGFESFEGRAGNDTINGMGGSDRADYSSDWSAVNVNLATGFAQDGFGGTDRLVNIEQARGSAFNDTLIGGNGANFLDGRSGDDLLDGGFGSDTLTGGAGLDTFFVSAGVGDVDRITDLAAGEQVGLPGSSGLDFNTQVLTGSDASTLSQGRMMVAPVSGGVTRVFLGLDSMPGADMTVDLVGTYAANDFVVAFNQDSVRIQYSPTGVSKTGSAADEWIYGSNYNDTLSGSAGNDSILGYGGNDSLSGGDGDDHLAADGGADTVDGGNGSDMVHYDLPGAMTSGVVVNLQAGTAVSAGVTDTLISIESASGTELADTLTGTAGANNLEGAGGNDLLFGQAVSAGTAGSAYLASATGGDTILGGGGNDTIQGGAGNDVLYGGYNESNNGQIGMGSDTFAFAASGNGLDVIGDFSADDAILVGANIKVGPSTAGNGTTVSGNAIQVSNANGVTTLFIDTNNVSGSDITIQLNGNFDATGFSAKQNGNGTSTITYSPPPLNLVGTAGTDSLVGAEGHDTLSGLDGSDSLNGNGGNDSILGGEGSDTLAGGAGNDTLDGGTNDSMMGGWWAGDRAVYWFAPAAVNVNLTTGTASDGQGGTDTLIAIENIDGSGYNDTLTGDAGDNQLNGNSGSDSINGGAGSDLLNGGFQAGAQADLDTLTGGTGTDLFDVSNAMTSGRTTRITDLEQSEFIQLSYMTAGAQPILNGDNPAGLLNGQVMVGTPSGGVTRLYVGLSGGTAAFVDLTGNFTASSFVQVSNAQVGNNYLFGNLLKYDPAANAPQNLIGTSAYDSLGGGNANDTINGLEGNDSLQGNGGNDSLLGGVGDDFLDGGVGNDTIDGGANGQFGDTIAFAFATTGVNVNLASGIISNDGAGGVDAISNVEHVNGTSFDDTLVGDGLTNWFRPGLGNDSVDGGAANNDVVMYEDASSGISVNLLTGQATGVSIGNDTLVGIEAVHGSSFDDTVTLSNVSGYVFGRGGNDLLTGGNGDDNFIGGSGNDTINGGAGSDQADYQNEDSMGGPASMLAGVTVNLATGTAIDNWGQSDTLTSIEFINGSDYGDRLTGGNPANGSGATDGFEGFRGNGGNDTMDGGAGFDRVYYDRSFGAVNVTLGGTQNGSAQDGAGGTDTLINIEEVRASGFNDVLTGSDTGVFESFEGRAGNDTIDGKGGTDRISYQTSSGGVSVSLVTGSASDGWGGTDTFVNIENVRGSDFNDAIVGDAKDNDLEGRAGNDTLTGGDGQDSLRGGFGDDVLNGGVQRILNGWDATANSSARYDIAYYTDASSGVTVTLGSDGTGGTATGGGIGSDTLIDIEMVIGSVYGDLIRGSNRAVNEIIRGGAGNDTMYGGDAAGTDLGTNFVDYRFGSGGVTVNLASGTATGADGNDVLTGFSGILSGNFNDSLTGDAQDNYIDAGAGNDTIDGAAGLDALSFQNATGGVAASLATGTSSGADGSDTFTNIEGLRGSEFADTLTGDANHNRIQGRDGADVIDGGAGNDTLHGGFGNDTLTGGAGNDLFQYSGGGEGVDRITDFASGDVIAVVAALATGTVVSGTGAAVMAGGIQSSQIAGLTTLYIGTDSIAGADITIELAGAFNASGFSVTTSGGVSQITYSATNLVLTGTAGSDTLTGGVGSDTLSGLGGNDTLNGGAGADSLDGGSGTDTASYADATTPVSVILYGNQAFGVSSGNDTLTAIENILGSAYSDLIYGDAADNVLDGGAGNDTLDGALGNDTLLGQTGDDLLNGLAGNDSLDGGDGNDTLFGWADNDTLVGGIGTDRLFGGAGADRLDGGTDADQLEGDDGADTLLGGAGNDTLRGWNDADSLDGGDGDNALFGGAGADSMQAGTGADQLEGDDGNDSIAGGAGNDTLRGWNDADSLDGGDGNDALFGGAGADAMMGAAGNDQLEGDDGNDSIAGGTGNDTLRGWNDSDSLSGDDGDDLLVGWSGNDAMNGGAGNDSLFGDDGADTLVGGAGGDVLQGGLGNDVYTFATGFGFDGVRDYDYLAGNSDTFQFTGINRADLSFARVGDALKVERTASAGADVIYINDWYQAGSNGAFKIETWVMGDASVFTAAQIEALV